MFAWMRPAVKIGQVTDGPTDQVPLSDRSSPRSVSLAKPSAPVSENCGNQADSATPICAVAAWTQRLALADVRPALEQGRGQPDGHSRGRLRDRTGRGEFLLERRGRPRQEHAQRVDGLPLAGLQRRNRRLGGGHQRVRIGHVERR